MLSKFAFPAMLLAAGISALLAMPAAQGARAAEVMTCLSNAQMREIVGAGKVVLPAEAMRTARAAQQGEAVRMRLCHGADEILVYQVTILKRDGKLRRVNVDAASGKVALER